MDESFNVSALLAQEEAEHNGDVGDALEGERDPNQPKTDIRIAQHREDKEYSGAIHAIVEDSTQRREELVQN